MKNKLLLACMLFGCAGVEEPMESARDSQALTNPPPPTSQPPLPQPAPITWEESTDLEPRLPAGVGPRRAPMPVVPRVATLTDRALASLGMPGVHAIGISLADGALTIDAADGDDTAVVTIDGTDVKVTLNGTVSRYPKSQVKKLNFVGGTGDDVFFNNTSLPSTANGGSGVDVLSGGSGADFLVGGDGDDHVYGNDGNDVVGGSEGNDQLWGGNGDDELYGHSGVDVLHGGAGRDSLNGGSGNDTLYGDDGMDLLVSVGLGSDTVYGGNQDDNFWGDAADTLADYTVGEYLLGNVHVISGFRSVKYADGSVTPVGLEPMGENLRDPEMRAKHYNVLTKKNFDDYPLFASDGPSPDDVFQGSVGDCFFVARLSAFAHADPEHIRRLIAPLGDGSYAVRLVRNGLPDYVRVDSDLWLNSSLKPAYAKLGEEGALWVALVEKAFAIARRDVGNYDSISGGNGLTLSTIPYLNTPWIISDSITMDQEFWWFHTGQLPGFVKTMVPVSNEAWLTWVDDQLDHGFPMITGAKSEISDATPIVNADDPATPNDDDTTWRRGQHVYAIDHVLFDGAGKPYGLVLRDPHGLYRTITDPVRLHYCIGRATRLTP
ncbi:MAG: hypothetical protein IPJ65_03770 [Archangiaceae bacterium]|nr:hypothetical protein [Archangiaceae bacterium]